MSVATVTATDTAGGSSSASSLFTVTAPPGTLFGSSLHNSGDVARLAGLGLPVRAVRCFLASPPAVWAKHPWLPSIPPGTAVVVSFSAGTAAQAAVFLASRPANLGPVIATWKHEPEDDIEKGTLTLADWKAKQVEWAPEFRRVGVIPAMILMHYTLISRVRRVSDYYLAEAHDMVCFDAYNYGNKNTPPDYSDPANIIDHVATFAESVGRPWGITEAGTPIINSAEQRAAWAANYAHAIALRGGVVGIWWDQMEQKDPTVPPFDARLDGLTAAAWHP